VALLASGGASVYVCGSQEPTPKEGQPVSKPSNTTTPPPKTTAPPATATPRARLRAQQLAARKAKARYEIARWTRELAEIALAEYEEVDYPRDLGLAEGEIALAESELARAKDRVEWVKRMIKNGNISISKAQKLSADLALKKAEFELEQALIKRKALVEYTRIKTIKELRSAVEKARADESAKRVAAEMEEIAAIELEQWLGLKL
jgi:hypothetical protein